MAEPIEFGLVIESEDARKFFENEENPNVTDEMIEMFKKAKKIYENNRF